MTYTLLGADGRPYQSDDKGRWGGHHGTKIYGQARAAPPSTVRIDPVANGWVRQYR